MQHRDLAIGSGDILDADDRCLARRRHRLLWALEGSHGPERLGVVLCRSRQHGARVALLDLIAFEQNFDPVGHLGNDGQIMRDVDRSRVELLNDVPDGGQHLDLGRHIKRCGRLVKDDQIGSARHRHRRHGALKLAARNLVRIAKPDLLRVRQTQLAVELDSVFLAFRLAGDTVLGGRFGVLIDQLVGGIEARRRGLRDIGNALA